MPSITPIRLNISGRLLDPEFRRAFFRAEAADNIALSIKDLRSRRNKRQKDLAKEARMHQSEISRIEQANYGRWTLRTLFKIADVLGARLRVEFDAIEDVIEEYKRDEAESHAEEQRAVYRYAEVSGADTEGVTEAGATEGFAIGRSQVSQSVFGGQHA